MDQTKTPLADALEAVRSERIVPFDVPGHKRGRGNKLLTEFLGEQCMSVDVNSMKSLDNLCHPVSVIREAEALAADAFGAAHAFFMVGGTTSAVQAMILSTLKAGDKIILPRNVHQSVINAMVLCGAVPVYVNPETDTRLGIALGMSLSRRWSARWPPHPSAKAILVNNPTYYGICSDISAHHGACAQRTACGCWRTRPTARTSISARICRSPPWRQARIWRPSACTNPAGR